VALLGLVPELPDNPISGFLSATPRSLLGEGPIPLRPHLAASLSLTQPPPCSLVRQRVFQIAWGYEDQNDSDSLRENLLPKVACDSLPVCGQDAALSRPSRMENAATMRSRHRIDRVLFELYMSQRETNGTSDKALLEFDSTETIPTEGSRKVVTATPTLGGTCVPFAGRLRWRDRAFGPLRLLRAGEPKIHHRPHQRAPHTDGRRPARSSCTRARKDGQEGSPLR